MHFASDQIQGAIELVTIFSSFCSYSFLSYMASAIFFADIKTRCMKFQSIMHNFTAPIVSHSDLNIISMRMYRGYKLYTKLELYMAR